MANWFYKYKDQPVGPIAESQMREWIKQKKLEPTQMVRQEGDTDWQMASSFPHLFQDDFGQGAASDAAHAGPHYEHTGVARGNNMKDFAPMTTFDKICAALSIAVGAVFMILGVIGLFAGANAHLALPPILGGLPFFLGWGMCIPLVKYWKMSNINNAENGEK